MVEIARRVAVHANPLHHPPRAFIGRHGERDDLIETRLFEPEPQRGCPGLGRVAVAPRIVREPPADLDRRREVRLERGAVQIPRSR
jgi:hypothetical protein